MILQVIHWANMAGTVLEAVLLLRLLMLKLHRVYAFVTLYWVVNVIFDVAQWSFGWESPESEKAQIYSLFVLAVLFPLVSWDVFEEMKTLIGKLRTVHGSRLVSGLFATLLLAAVWMIFLQDEIEKEPGSGTIYFALLVWVGSVCASLLFLWTLYRFAKRQGLAIPNNTSVLTFLFLILLACQFLSYLAWAARVFVGDIASDISVLTLAGVALTTMAWGVIRLRAVPADASSQSQEVSL
jgi:hypothetical protein